MLTPGAVVDLNVVVGGCRRSGVHLRDEPGGFVVWGYCTSPAVVVARAIVNRVSAWVLLLPFDPRAACYWAAEDIVEGNGPWR